MNNVDKQMNNDYGAIISVLIHNNSQLGCRFLEIRSKCVIAEPACHSEAQRLALIDWMIAPTPNGKKNK